MSKRTDLDLSLDLDLARAQRTGMPETIYGPGKSHAQIAAAAASLFAAHGKLLATRCDTGQQAAILSVVPSAVAHPLSGIVVAGSPPAWLGPVALISAGTADAPWVEETALVLAHGGARVRAFADCGVAGLHRLLKHLSAIRRCRVAVVVAGMDGALPSVVGGLLDMPIIACPTPIGYGTGNGGVAALHTMLNACSAGIMVVNIGNGFGAAHGALAICRQISRNK